MAATQFARGGTHTNLVPQRWSKNDFKWSFESNPLLPYMGTSEKSIIQVNKDFLKAQGDKITFALRALLSGDGQGDDGTYSGNEEAMVFYDMSVELAERGHSTKLNGNMTEQSAYAKLRPKGRAALREWVGRVQARDIIDALSGMTSKKFAGIRTGANAVDASSTQIATVNQVAPTRSATNARYFAGGQTTGGTVSRVANGSSCTSASHLFGTKVIEYVKRMAIAEVDDDGDPISPLRPVYVNGEPMFLFFVDPLNIKALRAESDWLSAQRDANLRGRKNPIFSGMAGIWDGVIIKPTTLLHHRYGENGTTSSEYFDSTSETVTSGETVVRTLFCGAQAACLAWGKLPVWKEGYCDTPHNTKWATHSDMIYGAKKSVYNSREFGSIIADVAVKTDT